MTTVVLVRHGRSAANTAGILAGRAAGVRLDDHGRRQAVSAGERLAGIPLAGIVSSPLERCRHTARSIAEPQAVRPEIVIDRGLTECDYGLWQGQALSALAKEPLWSVVQKQPSAAAFPEGESLAQMQARAVSAIRRYDAAMRDAHGDTAVWVAVSHGDVIKSILADALGMHLDLFQRITINPGSVSVIRYGSERPDVIATNTDSGDLSWLRTKSAQSDAPVGGGAGPVAAEPTHPRR